MRTVQRTRCRGAEPNPVPERCYRAHGPLRLNVANGTVPDRVTSDGTMLTNRGSVRNSATRWRAEPTLISTIDWNKTIAVSRDGYDVCVAWEVSPLPVDYADGTMNRKRCSAALLQ